MTAETAYKYKALEDQARKIRDIFTRADYEPVAPAIMQPADIFINQVGESLRGRTYVFSSLDGDEMCLRPDLTVPTCRLYLERHPEADCPAKFCYNGPAFRFQATGSGEEVNREFRQAGIENIGAADKGKAETEVLQLVSEAVKECGVTEMSIRFGDLGIFNALVDAIDMPDRWRVRLKNRFWKPEAFRELLTTLSQRDETASNGIDTIMAKLTGADISKAPELVKNYLEAKEIPIMGNRYLEEITERLLDQLSDLKADPLPEQSVSLIENYLSISSRPRAAGARISDLASAAGINLDNILQSYTKRLDLFTEAGIDISNAIFCAEYGRELEYYTGLVFQIEIPTMENSRNGLIAGGGRYDNLIGNIDDGHHAPAIGSAIHTERLLAAVEGATS